MREQDIRPDDLHMEYLRLSAADAGIYFPDGAHRTSRPCPACGVEDGEAAFEKNGFELMTCPGCGTLYVNPAPSDERLSDFYRDSASQRYWSDVFFPAVAAARREKIFRPRVERIAAMMKKLDANIDDLIDVGAGAGIFLSECQTLGFGGRLRAIEPNVSMAAALEDKGVEVLDGFVGDALVDGWSGTADLVTSFEVIEHVISPLSFVKDLAELAAPGGYILMTGPCGSGFDIRVLGERSNSVAPPHHLNFISRSGLDVLLERSGLELVSFETPGALDVELVRKATAEQGIKTGDAFVDDLMQDSDDAREAYQTYLADNGLSSHMWVIARKAANGCQKKRNPDDEK